MFFTCRKRKYQDQDQKSLDNTFSSIIAHETISGNLTATVSNHFISFAIFHSLVHDIWYIEILGWSPTSCRIPIKVFKKTTGIFSVVSLRLRYIGLVSVQ